jgi:hypothetical protein
MTMVGECSETRRRGYYQRMNEGATNHSKDLVIYPGINTGFKKKEVVRQAFVKQTHSAAHINDLLRMAQSVARLSIETYW